MIGEQDIRELPLFQGASKMTVQRVFKLGWVNYYERNRHIFFERTSVETVEMVLSGAACIYKMNEQGQKRNIFLLYKGKIINESFTPSSLHSANVQAFTDTTTLALSIKDFLFIMQEDFYVTTNVLSMQSLRIKRLYRQLKNTSIKIEQRIASKIWKMLRDIGETSENGIRVLPMKVSTVFLADMLGVQRESVSRGLAKLVVEGAISYENGMLQLLSEEKLLDIIRKP